MSLAKVACPDNSKDEIMRHTSSTNRRLAGAASILTLTSLMAASPIHAASAPSITESLQHFIDCAGWLVSDSAKHAQNCDPGHDFFVSGSSGFAADPEDSEG